MNTFEMLVPQKGGKESIETIIAIERYILDKQKEWIRTGHQVFLGYVFGPELTTQSPGHGRALGKSLKGYGQSRFVNDA